jgi:hypothetical protein
MTSPLRLQRNLPRRALVAAGLVAAAAALAGCGSTIADRMPTAAGGLPEGSPQRPTTPSSYPAVHDMPPSRATPVLSDADAKKLEDDLIATRNRAAAAAAKAAADADKP